MQPRQIIKNWPLIVGTIVVVSAVWGFFLVRMIELKDQQIALLEQKNQTSGLGDYVKSIDERLAKLSLASSIDPIDGRASYGGGLSTGTAVTELLVDINQLHKDRKFDLIEAKLAYIERLYPNFPGSLAVRYEICHQKGQFDEATLHAEKLLEAVPADKRLLPVYEFLINHKLKAGKKAEAESLALVTLRLDSDNTARIASFQATFGYQPSVPVKQSR